MRKAIGILTALTIMGLAAGCSRQEISVREKEAEPTHLTFFGFRTRSANVEEIDTILNKYMDDHPDVVITYEGLEDGYPDALENRIESGNADDIFMIHPSNFADYEAKGWVGTKIYDLTDAEVMGRYNDSVKRLITVNDKIFAAPMCMSVIGIVGNMDILKKCGVDQMPETYGEWVDSMEKVKRGGHVPLVNYLSSDASTGFLMAGRSMAPYVLGEKEQNSGDTAESVFKKGIEDLSALMDAGYIDREQMLASQDGDAFENVLCNVFAKGEAAYAVLPSWGMISFLEGKPSFEYQVGGLPLGDTGSVAMARASVPIAINNESPNREIALDFLDFLLQPENIDAYAANQQSVTPLKDSDMKAPDYETLMELVKNGKVVADTDPGIPFNLVKALRDASLKLAQGLPAGEVAADFLPDKQVR
ncbi:ABC transporter substrate-binding protein [Clostridium transplantifaecale]|uniref:ABC transporter substrate-binding protein n=1 Tax=Clostridium transplantifaecale TaxID=2479838 RepID=UPI000F632398|nr:extracellular solute-binding protein [Clostridium transplantifaecale]